MRKFNADNERTKRRYLAFLSEAKQLAPDTVDQVAAALADFERASGFKDFRLFRTEWAESYKRRLTAATSDTTGRPLSKATISARLAALKAFFQWLSQESGFKSRIKYTDAEYFNPSGKDARIARGHRERAVPSIEQIRHVLALMPAGTDIERRNRAVVAFTLLTGARDDATASLSLKHVDLERHRIVQDARDGVRTKNSKTITTIFFPVGRDVEEIIRQWMLYLRAEKLWSPSDPLFPATQVDVLDNGLFGAAGIKREHWKNAAALRRIFKEAFEAAGLPYFNPHSFRHTLVSLGERVCRTPEEFKAWSQNLGHEHVLTTFTSYGAVSQQRQEQIFAQLADPISDDDDLGRPVLVDPIQLRAMLEDVVKQQARTP